MNREEETARPRTGATDSALQDSEARYRAVVEDMPGMVCRFLEDGTLTFVNRTYCDYFEKAEAELIGRNFFEFIPADKQDEVRAHFTSLDHTRPMVTYEHEVIASDGSIRWQEWTDRVLFDSQGQRIEYQSVGRDVTEKRVADEERQRLETQLQHSRKMEAIGTLAGGVAHDFNNLLTTVLARTGLLLESTDAAHPHHASLKAIEEQVQRGARLTHQLLGYARKGRYVIKPLDLNRLVSDAAYTFRRTNKAVSFAENLAADLPAVEGNEDQVQQVILNVMVNAVDAMPSGGEIHIDTWNATPGDVKRAFGELRTGKFVMLSIRDTGQGMSLDVVARVFEPFFTTKDFGRGTGLGLASAYGIVESHGGAILVDSEEGQGTTFKICLPGAQRAAAEPRRDWKEPVEGGGLILIADDEPYVLDATAALIERLGYEVLVASGGEEAVDVFTEHRSRIDLVMLDLLMPVMDGEVTFEALKRIDPDVRVLLASGYSIDDRTQDLLARGCVGFVQKPFGLDLSAVLRDCFERIRSGNA